MCNQVWNDIIPSLRMSEPEGNVITTGRGDHEDHKEMTERLKKNLTLLKEKIDVDSILPASRRFLSTEGRDAVKALPNRGEKVIKILDLLQRSSWSPPTAVNAFYKILAGTHPELFEKIVGRRPSQTETDFCMKRFAEELKKVTKTTGHKIDTANDEEIDLDSQYVDLNIELDPDSQESGVDGQLPHNFQARLSKLEGKEGNSLTVSHILEKKITERIIFRGRVGIGKTTTLQWLALQWAKGKWATSFALLFLVNIRVLGQIGLPLTLAELLLNYTLFQVSGENGGICSLFSKWSKNWPARILILVDGLDEIASFQTKFENLSPRISDWTRKYDPILLCISILRGDLLPECMVISASRPFIGLNVLLDKPDLKYTMYEILGLTETGVKEYIEKKYPKKAKSIISDLERNSIVMSLCGITFYCMVISNLLSKGLSLKDTNIHTYTRLTAFILVQYVLRSAGEWPFVIAVKYYFPKLAQLAFRGTIPSRNQRDEETEEKKLVFTEYDLADADLDQRELEYIKKWGILNMKAMKIEQSNTLTAEFLHSSIQELMAVAYSLTTHLAVPEETLASVLNENQLALVHLFMFGLQYDKESRWIKDLRQAVKPPGPIVSDSSSVFKEFLENLCEGNVTNEKKLKICQLVHESQQQELAKRVVNSVVTDGKLSIEYTQVTAVDALAVDFVCQSATSLKEVTFSKDYADSTFAQMLTSTLLEPPKHVITKLDVSRNNIDDRGMKAIAEFLRKSTSIESLNVSHNRMRDEGGGAIADVLSEHKTLQRLNMNYNNLGTGTAKKLAKALEKNTVLIELRVGWNQLGEEGTEVIARGLSENLSENRTLKILHLSDNLIGDGGARAIAETLQNNTTLHDLYISNNNISTMGTTAIAEALKENKRTQIRTLDLSHAEWDAGDVKSIRWVRSLATLCLRSCKLDDEGAEAIAEALRANPTLTTLDVRTNNIGVRGARSLVRSLSERTPTETSTLDIRGNSLDAEGRKAIAEMPRPNNLFLTLK